MKPLLLCTDLDRTLIPNGPHPESPTARERFRRLVHCDEVTLVYVSGRHRALIEQALAEFDLPQPDYAIADVGSTLYQIDSSSWRQWDLWDAQIAPDWRGLSHDALHTLLSSLPVLKLQEQEKQNHHKLSYYVPLETDRPQLMGKMDEKLQQAGIKANLIWSIDELAHVGLLDILPASANKLHALHFLMQQKNFSLENTVFAGDSGNDLDVLRSDIPAVLVANADALINASLETAHHDNLYRARGNYLGMNGNYSAGILEGVAHFRPDVDTWLREHQ
ncbi:MAG: HAD-IIB family hydrolase [Sulfuriferula multivorans]|uniref:HAD-IIB family hydrolase n=1 Tax=Sulfuriferula multivorans TaxID=1559896 RepID=A0A7C9NYV3_9PROT|nr:HAD-IIB family hydrolase [Sulfuriferula multivorans]